MLQNYHYPLIMNTINNANQLKMPVNRIIGDVKR